MEKMLGKIQPKTYIYSKPFKPTVFYMSEKIPASRVQCMNLY